MNRAVFIYGSRNLNSAMRKAESFSLSIGPYDCSVSERILQMLQLCIIYLVSAILRDNQEAIQAAKVLPSNW